MNAKENKLIATARCHPRDKADNRGVAEGEDGYFNGTTGLPVGIHSRKQTCLIRATVATAAVASYEVNKVRTSQHVIPVSKSKIAPPPASFSCIDCMAGPKL